MEKREEVKERREKGKGEGGRKTTEFGIGERKMGQIYLHCKRSDLVVMPLFLNAVSGCVIPFKFPVVTCF